MRKMVGFCLLFFFFYLKAFGNPCFGEKTSSFLVLGIVNVLFPSQSPNRSLHKLESPL